MDVDETVDGKTWAHDFGQFSEEQSRLSSEHLPVFEAAAESNLTSRCSPPIAQVSKRPLCKNNALESKLKEHKYECPKIERECFDCGVKVLNENLQDNLDEECQKRVVLCDACHSLVTSTQFGKHKSECPKIERKCSDCGANFLNEKIQNHQEVECQKRVVLCDACKSAMSYDELSDHDQECLEKPVFCDDCEGEILRKERFKHAFECPMRLVYCESCEGVYAYSLEKEHREQCEKNKLACEYCELELEGDDEKNAHLVTCEDALIGCAFKEFGCNEKAPRKEMQEHEKHPHNALLNQVILEPASTQEKHRTSSLTWREDHFSENADATVKSEVDEAPACKHCKEEWDARELGEHEKACPKKEIQCRDCEEWITQEELSDHKKNCQFGKCNFCNEKLKKEEDKRKNIKYHEEHDSHALFFLPKIKELQERILQLEPPIRAILRRFQHPT
ncbi:TNF receptor-associated factor 6-B-like [Ixodes scapularis]|uniref:TNF receptor-associated factor 6-B-like n=1 Tax=Ixodes scapularis TaxID=6945 RepID=UPI001C38DDF9|nr:TNF receptor-associated factor 6-B-like [Ixodes scapularis]